MSDPHASPPKGGGSSDSPTAPLTLQASAVRASSSSEGCATYAVIGIRAPPPEALGRPRLSAVLVLDVSRSMTGEPLKQVLRSARRVAEILEDDDRLGVVTFATGATAAAPLLPLSEGRNDLVAALTTVRSDGGTNIAGALAQASLLFPRREEGERQLTLLMSDGEPTVGPREPAELGATARLLRSREVAVSTLGYGKRHHDGILSEIARAGGGRYAFVADPLLAERSFLRALGSQLDVVAEDVELLLTPGHGVEIVRVLENPRTTVTAGGLRLELGDLVAGDERHVVVELRSPSDAVSLAARLSGRRAGSARSFGLGQDIAAPSPGAADLDADRAAQAVVSVLIAAEMRGQARGLADASRFAEAEAELRTAQALVAATPGFVADDRSPLADAYQTLADEIRMMAARPSREAYSIHARATRDYADFALSGPAPRGSGRLSDVSPSSRRLLDRAMVAAAAPQASLLVINGPRSGDRLPLIKDCFLIGRAGFCDLVLADADVSRQHSVIELVAGAFWLLDMGSTNGPQIDGRRVARHQLAGGDVFSIGETLIRYEEGTPRVLH